MRDTSSPRKRNTFRQVATTALFAALVGDPGRCKQISDQLLERFAIYVQPINYPTVARGTERLRLTPSPLHSKEEIERLVAALAKIWGKAANRRVA